MKDFAAFSAYEAVKYLEEARKRLRDVSEDCIVFIAAMYCASEHHKAHRHYYPFHYSEFASRNRKLISENGGVPLPVEYDGIISHLAIGWFADPSSAMAASVCIQTQTARLNVETKPSWDNERHACGSMAYGPLAAFRLFRQAICSKWVVDPKVWERVPRHLQTIATVAGVEPFEMIERKTQAKVAIDACKRIHESSRLMHAMGQHQE